MSLVLCRLRTKALRPRPAIIISMANVTSAAIVKKIAPPKRTNSMDLTTASRNAPTNSMSAAPLVATPAMKDANGRSPQDRQAHDLSRNGRGGKISSEIKWLGREPNLSEGDVLEVAVRNGRWVLTHAPAEPRPAPPPAHHISRPRSDGVTGYVTSSHGAATPLRDGVTGDLAGNQPVRQGRVASVTDWDGGTLATLPGGCKAGVYLHADAKAAATALAALPADREFSSADPALRAISSVVSEILIGY